MQSSGEASAKGKQGFRRVSRRAQAAVVRCSELTGCGASPSSDGEAIDSDLATGANSRGRKEEQLPERAAAAPERPSDAGSPEDADDWKKRFAMMTDRMDMLIQRLDARMQAGTPSHLASENGKDPQPLLMRVPATRQRNDFSESDEDLRIRDESP